MASVPVSVTVPAEAGALGVVRTVAAGAAAAAGLDLERIDDVRLGIDEAGAALLGVPGGTRLHCDLVSDASRLEVRVAVDAEVPGPWPPQGWDRGLGARVLAAVAGDVAFGSGSGRSTVRFTV